MGCKTCPLRDQPKAKPSGSLTPAVYLLGEAPGNEEAAEGVPFVGRSGQILRSHIPNAWLPDVRFNNIAMSLPFKGNDGKQLQPSAAAIAHCRGYLVEDIERSAPRAIFGFGNVPLQAIVGESGINRYAGRRTPVRVGNHTCWYFAMNHPATILYAKERNRYEVERLFAYHLHAAFARVDNLPEPVIETPETAYDGIRPLLDANEVVDFLRYATTLPIVGFDFETKGLSPYAPGTKLLTAAVSTGAETVAFPLDHRESPWTPTERAAIDAELGELLCSETIKVAHKSEFEMLWALAKYGKRAARPTRWGDSLAQAFLLDARPRSHSLDFLCQLHFGLPLKSLSSVDVLRLDDTPLEAVLPYNALDAKFCLRVFERQAPELERWGMMPLYVHHMARMAALTRAQHLGLPVDLKVNTELTEDYSRRLAAVDDRLKAMPEVQAFERGGQRFNVNATEHVSSVLRSIGIHVEGTAEELLMDYDVPFCKAILEWRGINKVLSTYLLPLGPGRELVQNGELHPVINTTYTRTWRTSGEDPNIQNFPQREEENRIVRKQIVARPGHRIVSVDYSGIQARNVAMESRDRRLVSAFIERYDIHSDWRERIISRAGPRWAADRTPKALRHLAKNKLVFPFFFGAQPPSVSHGLGVDINVGYQLYEDFWGEFPEIRNWHDDLRLFYKRHNYVTGLSGFQRAAPISENQLINTPIQSDEALIVCDAMNRLSGYEDDALQPVLMIHDDLTFMIPDERFDECIDIILTEMLRMEYLWLNVPLALEIKAGRDWHTQVKIGDFESSNTAPYVEITS